MILFQIMVKSLWMFALTEFVAVTVAVSKVDQMVKYVEIFGTPWIQSPQETRFGLVAAFLFRFSGWVVMYRSNVLVNNVMQKCAQQPKMASSNGRGQPCLP
jgi:hypothetical protein